MKDLIQRIAEVDAALRKYTADYFNTRVFFEVTDDKAAVAVPYDINDMLLLGALTNSDILLSGTTGSGKSHLARMAMNAFFGADGFANLTVTPGLTEADFLDIDVGAVKSGKKTPKEAITTTPILTKPGATIHEINRTPEILQNVFISYLERIFSLRGTEFPVGVPIVAGKDGPQDAHYQFRVISINEGADYSGTCGIDRAVRDRVSIEVPMDYFRPRKEDIRKMIQQRSSADLTVERANGGKLEEILQVVGDIKRIPFSKSAEEFLVYLDGMNNCIKSSTHSKKGINFSSKDKCTGCHHNKFAESDKGNVCGSVYAPSDRSLINEKKIGRAVAALRAYKMVDATSRGILTPDKPKKFVEEYLSGLRVTLEDVIAAAPFILTSKMIIDPRWIAQYFEGSRLNAVRYLTELAVKRFKAYVESGVYGQLIKTDGEVTPQIRAQLEKYAKEKDPWAYSLKDLSTTGYERSKGEKKIEMKELLG